MKPISHETLSNAPLALPQQATFQDGEHEIDLDAAVREALAEPLQFPPLNQSIFAGDSVALLLQQDLPQPHAILEALLNWMADSEIVEEDVIVVMAPRTAETLGVAKENYQSATGEDIPPVFPLQVGKHTVQCQVHDVENQSAQAYLAANASDLPVYVNRTLVEADFVLPVGTTDPGLPKIEDCLYPHFSGSEANQRFRERKESVAARLTEIELANDMLGSFFTLQLVCGPGEKIHDVICGHRQEAKRAAADQTRQLWAFPESEKSGCAIATLESDARTQSWEQFAKAVVFADQFVIGEGPVIVWSGIEAKPDRLIKKTCQFQFDDSVNLSKLPQIYRQLAGILARRPIFLKSEQEQSVIEGLGLGFLENEEQLVRLIESVSEGILIRDAHKCQLEHDVNYSADGVIS